jgi:hypothetical protein
VRRGGSKRAFASRQGLQRIRVRQVGRCMWGRDRGWRGRERAAAVRRGHALERQGQRGGRASARDGGG